MFLDPKDMNVTEVEIQRICERLWEKETRLVNGDKKKHECPDCFVAVGQLHVEGCDIARCEHCKGQRFSCDCTEESQDLWTGLWPGIKEAYENKLICYDRRQKEWIFDLNKAAML